MTTKQRADLTFKDNLLRGRHGWLRLTPAYSVKIVWQILAEYPAIHHILEPFSGTGTTGLVAGQLGLNCDLYDINPFLVWLAAVKCANYSQEQIVQARVSAAAVIDLVRSASSETDALWLPPISHIERWWSPDRLMILARLFRALNNLAPAPSQVRDLLLVAFCRLIIQWSNAAFNHQSMSFHQPVAQKRLFNEEEEILQAFLSDLEEILSGAGEYIPGTVRACQGDSCRIQAANRPYDAVITSPPYVNRMSYIRELRPYMFWLGYLEKASDAGELDWQAVGGTWGIATSRLNEWRPENGYSDIPGLEHLTESIARSSEVLSRYVHKYFTDMSSHFASLYDELAPGGRLFYIVGNSKFYDTVVPVEQLYTHLMQAHGFADPRIQRIRKRNSKKELFEYLVTAHKPL